MNKKSHGFAGLAFLLILYLTSWLNMVAVDALLNYLVLRVNFSLDTIARKC